MIEDSSSQTSMTNNFDVSLDVSLHRDPQQHPTKGANFSRIQMVQIQRSRPTWRTISNGPPAFMMTNNSWRTRRHADQCQLTKSAGLGLVANLPVPRRSYFGLAVADTRRPFRLFADCHSSIRGLVWGWSFLAFVAASKVGYEVVRWICVVVGSNLRGGFFPIGIFVDYLEVSLGEVSLSVFTVVSFLPVFYL